MNKIMQVSALALSFLSLNATTPTTQPPVDAKIGVRSFEELAAGKKNALEAFSELVAKQTPVIVKFFKPGCPACKSTIEGFDTLAKQYKDKAIFITIDVTKYDLARKYGIHIVPTFFMFSNNKRIADFKRSGLKKEGFVSSIENVLTKLGIQKS